MDYCLKQKIYIIIVKNNRDYHDTTACVANCAVICLTELTRALRNCSWLFRDIKTTQGW